MSPLEGLVREVEARATLDQALATLLEHLSQRIKATSNDQNVQRLARELRIVAPDVIKAIRGQSASEG